VIKIVKDYFKELDSIGMLTKVKNYLEKTQEKVKKLHYINQIFYNNKE